MPSRKYRVAAVALALVWCVLAHPAVLYAHAERGAIGGFLSGLKHPVTGLDHVVAMFAVGLWGVFLGSPAMWLLPVVFPIVMAFGGALGILGVPLPGVEVAIALSGLSLGAMVASAARPPLWVAILLVGSFAIFHGHAHGTELPHAANGLTYAAGFVMATGLLHMAGIACGLLTRWKTGALVVRAAGATICLIGCLFLVRAL